MIWVKQLKQSLSWIWAFLNAHHGPLYREYCLEPFVSRLPSIIMMLDASPFGLGGVLIEDGKIITYFASELTHHDEYIHKQAIGDSRGQQAWECLAVLVALRIWHHRWKHKRVKITIKGDNKSALAMAARLKAGPSAKLVARELGLLYTTVQWQPEVEHIPGVANRLADPLSRLKDPNKVYTIPPQLRSLPRTPTVTRTKSWYKVLATE